MSHEQKLLLFRTYPTASHFNEAYSLALESARKEENTSGNRAEMYSMMHNFVKVGLALSIIFFFINIFGGLNFIYQLLKLLFITFILSLIWIVCFIGLLYQQEQQFFDDWRKV